MRCRLLLGAVAVAATALAAAGSASGGPSFWAMDQRLLTPEAPPQRKVTPTWKEQAATERLVWARYQQRANSSRSSEAGGLPFPLHTARHVRLLVGVLETFPERIPAVYAASVPWCLYWCCHSLDVLGAAATAIGPALRAKLWGALQMCQQPDGGFAGLLDAPRTNNSTSSSHVLSTYAALATAAILTSTNNASEPPPRWFPSKAQIKDFLLLLKHPTDGTFRATPAADAETDARSVYGALAVARLAGLLDEEGTEEESSGSDGMRPLIEQEKLVAYLTALQTHEGGFSGEGGDEEAHAGFSYCALAALRLLGAVDRVRDPEGLLRWCSERQRPFEGGCSGRTNKLVDACYSFWVGALPPLLLLQSPNSVLHAGALARYLLAVSQNAEGGGFVDKPGAEVDYYHTCYALSGLALAAHDLDDRSALLLAGLRGRVRRVDVALNLCEGTLRAWDASRLV